MAPENSGKFSQVRIIGGRFRRRKIFFQGEEGLRPTHDRIRETVFNWLAPEIENKSCLDVFSGSGAMGFEALSRGAKKVTFIDNSRQVIQNLRVNAEVLAVTEADFYCCDFMKENPFHTQQFDLVFLDPPFQQRYIPEACRLLLSRGLLKKNALIYFEMEKNSIDLTLLPETWFIEKQGQTQRLSYMLCRVGSEN